MAGKDGEKSFFQSLEERIELLRQTANQSPEGVEKLLDLIRSRFIVDKENGIDGQVIFMVLDKYLSSKGIRGQDELKSLDWRKAQSLKELEPKTNRVFYLERDFYSTPEVIIITAPSLEEAERILGKQLLKENNRPDAYKLTELDLTKSTTITLLPPGNRGLR